MLRGALVLKERMMVDINMGEELAKAGLAELFPVDAWLPPIAVSLPFLCNL